MPLAAVLLASPPALAGICLAVATCAAFVAHEPLLVTLGHRGHRARREDGPRARRWLALTVLVSVGTAAVALVLAPAALPWAVVPAALATAALLFTLRRSERTLGGELAAAAALTFAALPAAVASGLAPRLAIAVCAVFYLASVVSTVEVRAIARRTASAVTRLAAWIVGLGALALVAFEAPLLAACAAPTLLTVGWMAARRPAPSRLRQVGWTLAAAHTVTTIAVIGALSSVR